MANPIDTIYGYIQSLTNKRDEVALTKVFESVYPRRKTVNITAATTLSELNHGMGRIITINSAAGIALTLPASTGQGARFRFVVGTAVTSSTLTIKVANATDFMFGNAHQAGATGAATAFSTSNTGTAATESDTISMNGTTLGGLKGDYIDVEDYGVNAWRVTVNSRITGTAATPFSATV
jgi:hypothetical protein